MTTNQDEGLMDIKLDHRQDIYQLLSARVKGAIRVLEAVLSETVLLRETHSLEADRKVSYQQILSKLRIANDTLYDTIKASTVMMVLDGITVQEASDAINKNRQTVTRWKAETSRKER